MTEEDAANRITADVSRETAARLYTYVQRLQASASEQNLVAKSTLASIWQRHILDSAQLIPLALSAGHWVDIGSGAGLPGLVVAILTQRDVTLIEPRRLRAAFLTKLVDDLAMTDRVTVVQANAEKAKVSRPIATISARAVASLEQTFTLGARFANRETTWLLPKGRSARAEVASASRLWHAEITMVPSLTSPDSTIVVARGVHRR